MSRENRRVSLTSRSGFLRTLISRLWWLGHRLSSVFGASPGGSVLRIGDNVPLSLCQPEQPRLRGWDWSGADARMQGQCEGQISRLGSPLGTQAPQQHEGGPLLCGIGSGWSGAPLLKWSCPAQWGWEQKSVPEAAFSVECSNTATGGALLLPTVATPPGVRLLASGPVSCAGLRPRSPGARKGAAMLPPGCADPWSGCLRARSRASMVCVGPSGARRGRCVPFRHTWSPAL